MLNLWNCKGWRACNPSPHDQTEDLANPMFHTSTEQWALYPTIGPCKSKRVHTEPYAQHEGWGACNPLPFINIYIYTYTHTCIHKTHIHSTHSYVMTNEHTPQRKPYSTTLNGHTPQREPYSHQWMDIPSNANHIQRHRRATSSYIWPNHGWCVSHIKLDDNCSLS